MLSFIKGIRIKFLSQFKFVLRLFGFAVVLRQ